MTVAELIRILKHADQSATVVVIDDRCNTLHWDSTIVTTNTHTIVGGKPVVAINVCH